jgi:hypothetical protein
MNYNDVNCLMSIGIKDATMNFNPDIITYSHESSTILLSYNNMVPWLSYVTIFLYFEWFEYWCEDLFWVLTLVSFNIKYEMFANCDSFQYFENETIEIVCLMIELLCVFV